MRSDKERFLSMALRRKKTAKRVALGMAATLAFTAMGNVPMVENGITVYAAEEMSDSTDANIKFIDNGDGTASITGYTGKSTTFTIPTTVKSGGTEYNVTKIADQAFGVLYGGDSNFAPTSIIIPDTITYIGNSAFEGLTGITSITIGNGVTYVGSRAFYGLVGLTSISFPSSVANIGGSVCCGDTALKSVTIAGASSLGSSAFSGCAALETADLSGCSNLTVLPTETFYNCGKLTSVSLPSAISTIDASAFSGCKGLTSLSFPSGLTTIGEYAFNEAGITSLTLPSSITSIGNGAFMYCSSLKDVKVKANVTTLPASLFEGCVALETVNLPSGLTKIAGSVFKNNISLKNISFGNQTVNDLTLTFPDTMESIGNSAFKMGKDTDTDTDTGTDTDYEFKNEFSFINMGNGISDVGESAFEGFKANTFLSSPKMIIISDSICYRCGLTEVYIQEGATEIGDWAFKDNSIEILYFPSTITNGNNMGEDTFTRSDAGLITNIYTSKTKKAFNVVMKKITDLSVEGWYDVSAGSNLIPSTSFDAVKPKLDNGATDLGEEEVSVTGVSLDKPALELTEGDTTTLTATVTPDNATNTDVTWSSTNPSVATVDAEGNVTAVAAGTATITVTTVDEEMTATCVVTVTAKTTEIENFVDRLYTNLLNQSVNATEKASYVNSLSAKTTTAADAVADFALSDSIAKITNEEFVSRMYRAVFNRDADDGGRVTWENLLNNGMSRKIVIQKFTESEEFANICASCGMAQGKYESDEIRDSNIYVTSFVNNLYLTILWRTPDAAGINNFVGALLNGASTDGIIKEFILGAECTSKNYTNEEFIIACFGGILGRTGPTVDAIDGGRLFLDTLNAGGLTREGVVNSLLNSEEYKNRLNAIGLTK